VCPKYGTGYLRSLVTAGFCDRVVCPSYRTRYLRSPQAAETELCVLVTGHGI
jgi:hypothetical protein